MIPAEPGITNYKFNLAKRSIPSGLPIRKPTTKVAVDLLVVTAASSSRQNDEDQLADGMSLVAQARSPVSGLKESVRIGVQFLPDGAVAMMELAVEGENVKIAEERHYRLVAKDELTDAELAKLRTRT